MTLILTSNELEISQKNFQQVVIRGNGNDEFNQIINKEISMTPPKKNLETTTNEQYLFAKNSFDQWSLIYLKKNDYKKILQLVSNLNENDEILASDYSYGQVYFEIKGI